MAGALSADFARASVNLSSARSALATPLPAFGWDPAAAVSR